MSAKISQEELDRAVEAGRARMDAEFRAKSVRYDAARDVVELTMIEDWGLVFRRADILEFRDVAPKDMEKIEVSPAGMGLEIDDLDIHIGINGLVTSFISPHLMAKSLGRRGGGVRSEAKQASARENGKKGGRPRKLAHSG